MYLSTGITYKSYSNNDGPMKKNQIGSMQVGDQNSGIGRAIQSGYLISIFENLKTLDPCAQVISPLNNFPDPSK